MGLPYEIKWYFVWKSLRFMRRLIIDEGAVDYVCVPHENYCNAVRSLRQIYGGTALHLTHADGMMNEIKGEYHADGGN